MGSNFANETISPTGLEINGKWQKFELSGYIHPPNGMSAEEYTHKLRQLELNYIADNTIQNSHKIFYQDLRNARSLSQVLKISREYFNWAETSLPRILAIDKQQILSQSLLRSYFLHSSPTLESQQGIEFYLQVMMKHEIWKATELYAPALLSLRGYWTEEKITQVAKTIIAHRYPEFKSRDDFFQPVAWVAIKSGYVKDDANIALYTLTNVENKFAQEAMSEATQRLYKEYTEYINQYPNKQLPKIPHKDNKGLEIIGIEESQGLALLTILAKVQ